MIHCMLLCCIALSPQPVQLDGNFEEWPLSITGAGSREHVYLQMLLPRPVNLQGLAEPMTLKLDWDNNTRTGKQVGGLPGVDLEVLFSPKRGSRGSGVSVRRSCDQGKQSWDVVDLVFSPTVASDRFEIRLPRTLKLTDTVLTAGGSIPWELSWTDPIPARGKAAVAPRHPAAEPVLQSALQPASSGEVRVVTWNLQKGNLLKQRDAVTRVLAAIEPDIVLIQEIEDGQTEHDLVLVLQEAMRGTDWTTSLSPRSGTIKSGIATRLPARQVPSFKKLKRRGESHGHVRAAALNITVPNVGNVLAVSVHLKCCGVAGGPEDITRIGEVMAIRRAVASAETSVNFRGLIIGGDLNLVGGLLPLQMLISQGEGLIEQRDTLGDLLVVEAMQPDGQGVQTWQENGQSYTPGQLDYIVVTGSSLQPTTAVVLDTLDLPSAALQKMSLQRSDTAEASDHLPVIVDLAGR
jgi:endonuclease/exonuclease/phosphatase family metal-dependent hydrolase